MEPARPTSDGAVSPEQVEETGLKQGDVFFNLGYVRRAGLAAARAKAKGATIVEVVTDDTSEPSDRITLHDMSGPQADIHINPHWNYGDAVVQIEGYDVRECAADLRCASNGDLVGGPR